MSPQPVSLSGNTGGPNAAPGRGEPSQVQRQSLNSMISVSTWTAPCRSWQVPEPFYTRVQSLPHRSCSKKSCCQPCASLPLSLLWSGIPSLVTGWAGRPGCPGHQGCLYSRFWVCTGNKALVLSRTSATGTSGAGPWDSWMLPSGIRSSITITKSPETTGPTLQAWLPFTGHRGVPDNIPNINPSVRGHTKNALPTMRQSREGEGRLKMSMCSICDHFSIPLLPKTRWPSWFNLVSSVPSLPVRMDWSTRNTVDLISRIRISAGTLSPTMTGERRRWH